MTAEQMTLKKLMIRIRVLTKERGAKTRLAEWLKISRQQLHGWLRKKSPNEPSGDHLLRLLEWATAEEAKQKKTPGVLSTRRALKAQVQKSRSNDKPSSGRRKT